MLFPPAAPEGLTFNAVVASPTGGIAAPPGFNWCESALMTSAVGARPWFYVSATGDLVGDADPGSFPDPGATDVLVELPGNAWSHVAIVKVSSVSSGVSRGEIVAPEAWPAASGVIPAAAEVDTRADNKGFAGVALHNAAAGEYLFVCIGGYCPYALIQATGGADTIAAGDQLNCATEVFGFAVVAQGPAFAIATTAKGISTAQDAQAVWITHCAA